MKSWTRSRIRHRGKGKILYIGIKMVCRRYDAWLRSCLFPPEKAKINALRQGAAIKNDLPRKEGCSIIYKNQKPTLLRYKGE